MNGVEILNQTEILEYMFYLPILVLFLGFVLLFVFFIIFQALKSKIVKHKLGRYILRIIDTKFDMCIVLVLIIFFISFVIEANLPIHTGKYEYETIIEDNADFKEIYNKYEIVEQKGKIFILRDK